MNVPIEHQDQAQTLRSRRGRPADGSQERQEKKRFTRVFSVTSGKGGVGKTAIVSNLAMVLAKKGKKVLVIDADLGLANIDVIFGLAPRYNLNNFFNGEQSLRGIIADGPRGIKILPAGSGIQRFTHLDAGMKMHFLEELGTLHGEFDVVLIDTESGISENVTYFNAAAQDILVVTTPDPTAITDAYTLMKLLSTRYDQKQFYLVVNFAGSSEEGLEVFQKLTMVSHRYLDISIDFLGCITADKRMPEALRRQKTVVELYPGGRSSLAIESLANSLDSAPLRQQPKGTLQFFWKQFLGADGDLQTSGK
ncbi:MAG TPA: MinD/ParA family protein [Desulfuromonadales bacterium]|nr:MinD/ParA family protein [Desulfuromonadales bacterium]